LTEPFAAGDVARYLVGGALALAGAVSAAAAALGLMRFPDIYARLHAVSLAPAFAAPLACAGFAVMAWDLETTLRLGALCAALAVLGPGAALMLASAAHGSGLAPAHGADEGAAHEVASIEDQP